MKLQKFVTRDHYWRRLRLALWLAWHALRGNTAELEWGDEYTTFTAVGITTKVKQ